MSSSNSQISVLFVCLGNICRSTMSEGVFRSIVSKPPYKALIKEVDSCGTAAYHVGDSPDSRTMSTLEDHGINDYRHSGRQLRKDDFNKFDYIFAMDKDNLRDIQSVQRRAGGSGKAKVMLFGEWNGKSKAEEVLDPYYGARDGFEIAYEQAVKFSNNFLLATFPETAVP